MDNRKDSDNISLLDELKDEFQEGKVEMERKLGYQTNTESRGTNKKVVSRVASNAKSNTVTEERLMGKEQYFFSTISYFEEKEQPHFLFPLTQGLFAEPALIVETGPDQKELLSKSDGGTVAITNRYVRIHSSKGEWTIPYNSIASVDFVGHPALHIQTSGRTYYIRIAGTFFDEEQNLSKAAKYIREMQRNSREETQSTSNPDPIDQLEKLSGLKEEEIISEKDFERKKQELLDEI